MKKTFSVTRGDKEAPLSLVLMCSDDPQHTFLRYLLEQQFPGFRCIVEPNDGQVRHLMKKGRDKDVRYMKYHGRRRRKNGDSASRKAFFGGLVPEGFTPAAPDLEVDSINCQEVWSLLEDWKPEVTICAGTKYIGKKAIARAGTMLNLHTGHLPDYKGNQCIFFTLLDREYGKISGTIHQLSSELDGGAILERVVPEIRSTDSEEDLYARIQFLMINRVVELCQKFREGATWTFKPQPAGGRMFRHRDRTPWKEFLYRVGRMTGRIRLPDQKGR